MSYGQTAPAPSMESLPELDATAAVELLCSRTITARQYLEALYARLWADGYSCLNAFQYVNTSQVICCYERLRRLVVIRKGIRVVSTDKLGVRKVPAHKGPTSTSPSRSPLFAFAADVFCLYFSCE